MIKNMELMEHEEELTMVYRSTMSPFELKNELAKHLPQIYQTILQNGKQVVGMPFTIYHRFGEDEFDVEMGMRVEAEFEYEGDYYFSKISQGQIIKANYFGPYGKLDEGYKELEEWGKSKGYEIKGPNWEVYVSDPMEVEDISQLQTDIHIFLQD